MNAFNEKIRELRRAKGVSLRTLASKVSVGYLREVKNGKLDFGDSPSEALIHRLRLCPNSDLGGYGLAEPVFLAPARAEHPL